MSQTLAPSELILNEDGSIYHLHLLPEDIATTIITVGDPSRVASVSKHFDTIEVEKTKREFCTHTGTYNGKRLSVISTGIGPDNIDIVFNELDALVNIDLSSRMIKAEHQALNFIRLGTSGCLQANIAVDELVFSRYSLGFDNLLSFYDYAPAESAADLVSKLQQFLADQQMPLPITPHGISGSTTLIEQLASDDVQGITITAPGFYAPQGRQLRASSKISPQLMDTLAKYRYGSYGLTNLEMETSAIYGMSKLLGHEALSCSVILANRANGTFSQQPARAVELMIGTMLDRITNSSVCN